MVTTIIHKHLVEETKKNAKSLESSRRKHRHKAMEITID